MSEAASSPPPATPTPGRSLRPEVAAAFAHLARPDPDPGADPVAAMRRRVDRYGDVGPRPPLTGVVVQPIEVGGRAAEWICPDARVGRSRILLLHGGGWIAGGLESHRPLAAALARAAGAPVLLPAYRLAPEHPFPAAFEDCRAALAFAAGQGPGGAEPGGPLHLVGDSAGGNLAAAVCVDAVAGGRALPDRLALLSPALEAGAHSERGPAADLAGDHGALAAVMALYLQGRAGIDDLRVSPLRAPAEVLARFPPTLLQASAAEFLLWDSRRFAERLAAAGVRVTLSLWPDMPHVWHAFLDLLPEAREAVGEVAAFLAAAEGAGRRGAPPP